MAKPSDYTGANVALTDTFSSWVELTNEITYDLATVIVTVGPVLQPNTTNGAWTTGNAHIEGRFSANVAVATDYLRGGTVQNPSTLYITTNTMIEANGSVGAAGGIANNFIVSNNTVSQLSGNVYITTAGGTGNAAIGYGKAYTDENLGREFIVDFGTFTHTQGLMTVSGNTIFDMASVGDNSGRVDIDVQDLDVTANSYFFAQNFTANNRSVEIGFAGTDYMNVNSESFFHANVTIGDDGTDYLLVNSNTYFTSNVQIGDSATADFLTVNSNTFINNHLTVGSDGTDIMNVKSVAYFNSNTTIGDTSADRLYVKAQTEIGANATVNTSVGLFKSDAANNYFSTNTMIGNASNPGASALKVYSENSYFYGAVSLGDSRNDTIFMYGSTSQDILPVSDVTDDLGSTDKRYAEIHVRDAFITNNVEAGLFSSTSGRFLSKDASANLDLIDITFGVANSTATFDIFGANTTAIYDIGQDITIGTADNPWKAIYIDGIDLAALTNANGDLYNSDTVFTDLAQYITSANVVLTAPRIDFANPESIIRIKGSLIIENDSFAGYNSLTANNLIIEDNSELRKAVYFGNTDGNDPEANAAMTVTFGANTTVIGDIIPNANVTYDLGSPTKYFDNIYVHNFNSDNFSLLSLNDVTMPYGGLGESTDGYKLVFDSNNQGFTFEESTLSALRDVDTSNSAPGTIDTYRDIKVLASDPFNATSSFPQPYRFVNLPQLTIYDLQEFESISPNDNQVLEYYSGVFRFVDINLSYLSDVDLTGATSGQFLKKGATNSSFADIVLTDISNVNTAAQANASILYYNADDDNYQFSTLAGLYADVALGDVTDVDATATAGQVLTANSTGGFEFTTLNLTTTLEALTDVDINSPSVNQVLKYDGTKWVNGVDDNFIGATVSIDTVPPTSPTNGDLWYDDEDGLLSVYYEDGTSSQWVTIGGGGAISQAVANAQVGSVNDLTDGVTYNSGVSIGVGANALANDDGTTNYNTAFGFDALRQVTSGNQNVGIGANAGENLITGFNNIVIGYNASASSSSAENEITLGDTNIFTFRVPGLNIFAQGNYFTAGGVDIDTGDITATSFNGDLFGNVTGTVSSLSNHSTSNVTFNRVTATDTLQTTAGRVNFEDINKYIELDGANSDTWKLRTNTSNANLDLVGFDTVDKIMFSVDANTSSVTMRGPASVRYIDMYGTGTNEESAGGVSFYYNNQLKMSTVANGIYVHDVVSSANVVATNSVSAANVVSSGGVIGSEFIAGSQANPAFFANSSVVEITNLGAVGSNTTITISDFVSVAESLSSPQITASKIYTNVITETVNNIGTGNSITVTSGGYVISTPSASISYSFDSTDLLSGRTYSFVLRTTPSAAITITWPANVLWSGGIAPDVPASGETDTYIFVTTDQGATWYGYQSGDAFA